MDPKTLSQAVLRAKDPAQISLYLQAKNWTPHQVPGGTSWTLHDETEVLIPRDSEIKGYTGFIRRMLEILANVEDRPELDILRDISMSTYDSLLIRTQPDAPSGSIPILDGAQATESLKQWILSGAVAATSETPRLIQPTRKPAAAMEVMRSVLLGPSIEGSYIFAAQIPIPPRLGQETLDFDEPVLRESPPPLNRKVSMTLYEATRIALDAATDVVNGAGGLHSFTERVDSGISANLCEALSGISGDSDNAFEIRFNWSLGRPAESTRPLRFSRPIVSVLSQVSKDLRDIAPMEEVRLLGNVVRLHRDSRIGPGQVSIAGVLEDEPNERLWRVWLELSEIDYEVATRAHAEGRLVSVRGDLIRRGNRFLLRNISGFRVLPDSSS